MARDKGVKNNFRPKVAHYLEQAQKYGHAHRIRGWALLKSAGSTGTYGPSLSIHRNDRPGVVHLRNARRCGYFSHA